MRYCCLNLASLCEQLQFEILWKICNHIWLKLRKNLLKTGKNCYHWRGGSSKTPHGFLGGWPKNHVRPQGGRGGQIVQNSVPMFYGRLFQENQDDIKLRMKERMQTYKKTNRYLSQFNASDLEKMSLILNKDGWYLINALENLEIKWQKLET